MFGDFFNKILSRKKVDSVIGIDVGSAFLKVVQVKKKSGHAVLETYGELALGPYANLSVGQSTNLSASKISEAVKDLFKESNITTTSAAVSLPLSSSLLSVIDMPAVSEQQLAKMIPIEARKHIPVPITEVSLDWWIIPKDKRGREMDNQNQTGKSIPKGIGKTEVMVVAIHNETLSKYGSFASDVGLVNTFFELEVFSTARSTFGNTLAPIMILDIGAGSTKVAIIEQGVIRSQHIINRGSQEITLALSRAMSISIDRAEQLKREVGLQPSTEADKKVAEVVDLTMNSILSEANRSILNYQRRFNVPIGHVVLAGGGALLKGLFELASKQLETEVRFADPFSKLQTPAFLDPVLKDAGPEFAVAIGLALRKLQELE